MPSILYQFEINFYSHIFKILFTINRIYKSDSSLYLNSLRRKKFKRRKSTFNEMYTYIYSFTKIDKVMSHLEGSFLECLYNVIYSPIYRLLNIASGDVETREDTFFSQLVISFKNGLHRRKLI